jgi:hypothetical protein
MIVELGSLCPEKKELAFRETLFRHSFFPHLKLSVSLQGFMNESHWGQHRLFEKTPLDNKNSSHFFSSKNK